MTRDACSARLDSVFHFERLIPTSSWRLWAGLCLDPNHIFYESSNFLCLHPFSCPTQFFSFLRPGFEENAKGLARISEPLIQDPKGVLPIFMMFIIQFLLSKKNLPFETLTLARTGGTSPQIRFNLFKNTHNQT